MNKNGPEQRISAKGTFYKFIVTFSGALLCISFGMMLGWPSPTYPKLLQPDTVIPITLDETAMVAGMLLNGYVISTPFAGINCINNKYSLIIANGLILSGWLLLYFATNVLGLCLSRAFVGLGAGFGTGKYKDYVSEIFNPQLSGAVLKRTGIYTVIGMVTSFIIGPFMDFRVFPIVAAVVPAVSLISFIFAPESTKKLYDSNNIEKAAYIIEKINGAAFVQEGLEHIRTYSENRKFNFFQILRNKYKRRHFIILTFVMTVQQFTGAPALIVYSQLVFTDFGYIYPQFCSVLYIVLYLIFTFLGTKYMHKYRRKHLLLSTLLGTTLMSIIHAAFLYFRPENEYLNVVPLVTMSFYVVLHTLGLSVVPALLINDLFLDNSKYTINCYTKMYTAELAVIVTKIFQVLYGTYGMYIGFSLFSAVGVFGTLIVLCCFNETKDIILSE